MESTTNVQEQVKEKYGRNLVSITPEMEKKLKKQERL